MLNYGSPHYKSLLKKARKKLFSSGSAGILPAELDGVQELSGLEVEPVEKVGKKTLLDL